MKFKKILLASLPIISINSFVSCGNDVTNIGHNVTLLVNGKGANFVDIKKKTIPHKDYVVSIVYQQGFEFGKINVFVGIKKLNMNSEYSLLDNNTKLLIPSEYLIGDIFIMLMPNIQWDYNPIRFEKDFNWTINGDYVADIRYAANVELQEVWILLNKITSSVRPSDDDILFRAKCDETDFKEKILQYFSDETCTKLTIPAEIFEKNPIVAIKITCKKSK